MIILKFNVLCSVLFWKTKDSLTVVWCIVNSTRTQNNKLRKTTFIQQLSWTIQVKIRILQFQNNKLQWVFYKHANKLKPWTMVTKKTKNCNNPLEGTVRNVYSSQQNDDLMRSGTISIPWVGYMWSNSSIDFPVIFNLEQDVSYTLLSSSEVTGTEFRQGKSNIIAICCYFIF